MTTVLAAFRVAPEPNTAPIIVPRRLRSTDQAALYPAALRWMRAETVRHDWGLKAREDAAGKVTGVIGKIISMGEPDGSGRIVARVDYNNVLYFAIADFDGHGIPEAYVSRDGPVQDIARAFRVYHEYNYSADAVYSLERFLTLDAPVEAWYDRPATTRRRLVRFSWWRAFLIDERRRCNDEDRLREINRLMTFVGIPLR